ncbi:hypothetical protein ACLOAU_13555 [Niabella sp. CJ426]|uniref:hypothetical protein n=1 Tax=Niabella sp. CJ426 TaxID=3393740 RepID=UPI003D06117A
MTNEIIDTLILESSFFWKRTETYVGKILLIFCIADQKQNEFYNHYAFELSQNLLEGLANKKANTFEDRLVMGVFLQKCIKWQFMAADLKRVFAQLDDLCHYAIRNKESISPILNSWIIIYLNERIQLCGKKEKSMLDSLLSGALNQLDFQVEDISGRKINPYLMDMLQDVFYHFPQFQNLAVYPVILPETPTQKIDADQTFVQLEQIINNELDKMVIENDKYKSQQLFYKSLL